MRLGVVQLRLECRQTEGISQMRHLLGLVAIVQVCCVVSADVASARTPEEVAEAQREQQYEEAKAAARKARYGELPTESLPKGGGAATDLHVEGKIVAYDAVDTVAETIATAIKDQVGTHLVMFSAAELRAIQQHRMFRRQIKALQDNLTDYAGGNVNAPKLPGLESDTSQTCGGPTFVPQFTGGALPLLAVGLQVLSLFKNDKTIDGNEFEIDEFALSTAVISKLKIKKSALKVLYPASYFPSAFSIALETPSENSILREPAKLTQALTLVELLLKKSDERKGELGSAIGASGVSAACKLLFKRDLEKLAVFDSRAKALQAIIQQLQVALMKVDEKTGTSGLQVLYAAETLAENYKSAHILLIKVVAAGGATLAKTNLFTTNFFFSGGVVVSYMLLHGQTGDVILASVLSSYGGFIPAEQLKTSRDRSGAAIP